MQNLSIADLLTAVKIKLQNDENLLNILEIDKETLGILLDEVIAKVLSKVDDYNAEEDEPLEPVDLAFLGLEVLLKNMMGVLDEIQEDEDEDAEEDDKPKYLA